MRISMLTPGTGYFYCGNCLRDNTLAHALKKLDHDVTMIPLYLPFFTEGEPPPRTERVFLGGINIYLQHKLPLFGKLPEFLTRILDSQYCQITAARVMRLRQQLSYRRMHARDLASNE